MQTALESLGLSDTAHGRRSYRDYLAWLSADEAEQKKLGFEQMCRGWAKGSKEFKKGILDELSKTALGRGIETDAQELKEAVWDRRLDQALALAGRNRSELTSSAKGAE